jgi:hypothetical protein
MLPLGNRGIALYPQWAANIVPRDVSICTSLKLWNDGCPAVFASLFPFATASKNLNFHGTHPLH